MTRQPNKNISTEKIIEEFAIRRASITKLAIFAGIISGAAMLLLYVGVASNVVTAILLAAVFIAAAFINIKLWRCPACNGHLGKLYLGLKGPKFCPACGIKLST